MKLSTLVVAIVCAIFTIGIAAAQQKGNPNPMPFGRGVVQKLNLTDSQKKDVEKLNSDLAKQRVDQQAKIKTAAIELRELMRADQPDKGAIEKKIGQIADLQAQNRMLGINHWFGVNKLLTPDQQKIWKETLNHPLRARMAMRMNQMHDRAMRFFRGRPGPPQDQER